MARRSALAWAALVLPLLIGGRSAAADSPRGPDDYHATARRYGASKVDLLRGRWNDARINAALRRLAPAMLPGVPLEAALALGVSSTGPREDLGTAVGLWGVERRFINAWSADDTTRAELGRAYDSTRYADDVEAQVYTGLRRYRDAMHAAARTLGADFRSADAGPWEYQSAVAAYSSGAGALGSLARPHASQLVAAPRSRRFATFAELVSADCERAGSSGTVAGLPVTGLVGAAWTVTRPRERYEAARALATALGRPLGWYTDPGVSEAVDRQLGRWTHGTQ